MNYKNLILLATVSIFFSACSPHYNVQPNYNKKQRVVTVDDFKLERVSYENTKARINKTQTSNKYTLFRMDDQPCMKLAYRLLKTPHGRYFSAASIEDTLEQYNGDCEVEKIGNLNFFRCMNTQTVSDDNIKYIEKNMHYGFATSVTNQYGYAEKLKIFLGTQYKCFNKIKNHFKMKTDPKYVEITHNFKKDN